MNQDNKIQSFTLEDLDAVVKIENKCHLIPWTRKNFNDSHNAKNLFNVLKNGDDIIGYCIGLFAVDECQLLIFLSFFLILHREPSRTIYPQQFFDPHLHGNCL